MLHRILWVDPFSVSSKTLIASCSKRSQRRGARRSMSGGVLFLYVDAKSVERNEAYESFSAACLRRLLALPQAQQSVALLLVEMTQCLIDDVHSYHLVPCCDQADCNGARGPFADLGAIDRSDRHKGGAGTGQKSLIGVTKIVGRVIPLHDFDPQLLGKIEDYGLGAPAEDVSVRGR